MAISPYEAYRWLVISGFVIVCCCVSVPVFVWVRSFMMITFPSVVPVELMVSVGWKVSCMVPASVVAVMVKVGVISST